MSLTLHDLALFFHVTAASFAASTAVRIQSFLRFRLLSLFAVQLQRHTSILLHVQQFLYADKLNTERSPFPKLLTNLSTITQHIIISINILQFVIFLQISPNKIVFKFELFVRNTNYNCFWFSEPQPPGVHTI